eukprot:623920-Ditylum_brightwellii.AAC.1
MASQVGVLCVWEWHLILFWEVDSLSGRLPFIFLLAHLFFWLAAYQDQPPTMMEGHLCDSYVAIVSSTMGTSPFHEVPI